MDYRPHSITQLLTVHRSALAQFLKAPSLAYAYAMPIYKTLQLSEDHSSFQQEMAFCQPGVWHIGLIFQAS